MSHIQDQISHLSKLAALNGSSIDISSVLESFGTLQAIDTSSIHEVSRSGNKVLIPREDSVVHDETLPDKLLSSTKQRTAAHQIVLSGIMHGE